MSLTPPNSLLPNPNLYTDIATSLHLVVIPRSKVLCTIYRRQVVLLAVRYPVVMYSVLYTAVRSPSTPISASLFPVIWHNKPSILCPLFLSALLAVEACLWFKMLVKFVCPLFLSALLAEEAGLRFKMLLKFISLHTPTGFIVSVGCSVGGWGLPHIFLDFGENLVYSPLLLLFLPLLGVLFLHFRAPYFHHHCFY